MKLELFVFQFDVFPHTERFAVLEVARVEESSWLKKAPGPDDSETSRRDLLAQHRRFLEASGATMREGVENELSPLVMYTDVGLAIVKGKTFARSGVASAMDVLDVLAA
jgi:UDP-N-acetylglucosamine/UDP-N-acetylgalactosamine diphosphorylase